MTTKQRPHRYHSPALVEVRTHRWLPLRRVSAVLLNLSQGGLKAECTGDFSPTVGYKYWIDIPLIALGSSYPDTLSVQVVCKWVDAHRKLFGAEFIGVDQFAQAIIEQVIEFLEQKEAAGDNGDNGSPE